MGLCVLVLISRRDYLLFWTLDTSTYRGDALDNGY